MTTFWRRCYYCVDQGNAGRKVTHLACITYWHERRQVIQCPCHDGRFNPLNGTVISGPPPRPLPIYELEVVGQQVYIGEAKESVGSI